MVPSCAVPATALAFAASSEAARGTADDTAVAMADALACFSFRPQMGHVASGMDAGAVLVATALTAAVCCTLIGVLANHPVRYVVLGG